MLPSRDLGIDFHTNCFTVCFRGSDGEKTLRTYETGKRFVFHQEISSTDSITIEAMTGTFAFVRELASRVSTVNIVDPVQFPKMHGGNKTDKIDSKNLAEAGYRLRTFSDYELARVYMPDVKISELRGLFTGYNQIVKKMTMTKNRIHSILKDCLHPFNGENIMTKPARTEISALNLPAPSRLEIRLCYEQLDLFDKHKADIEESIHGYAKFFESDVRHLISIPGVSIFVALALKADYADVSRFKNAKHFCSYLRTAPKIESSNETVKNRGVNKMSRKIGLQLLLQGLAHTWGDPGPIQNFRERKIKGKSKGKVRIAVARKIMTAMYYMLKKKELYFWMNTQSYERKIKELKGILEAA